MTSANDNAHGHATIDPAYAVAGRYGTWRLSYVAGSAGIAEGGCVRVYTDSDTDWEMPQFLDPSAPDYMTVEAPGTARSCRNNLYAK